MKRKKNKREKKTRKKKQKRKILKKKKAGTAHVFLKDKGSNEKVLGAFQAWFTSCDLSLLGGR